MVRVESGRRGREGGQNRLWRQKCGTILLCRNQYLSHYCHYNHPSPDSFPLRWSAVRGLSNTIAIAISSNILQQFNRNSYCYKNIYFNNYCEVIKYCNIYFVTEEHFASAQQLMLNKAYELIDWVYEKYISVCHGRGTLDTYFMALLSYQTENYNF